jgi:hypothetical protein
MGYLRRKQKMKVYLILKIVGTNFDILNVCLTKKEANNFCSQLKKDLKNDGYKITKTNNNIF